MSDEDKANEHTVPRHVYEKLQGEYDQLMEAFSALDEQHTELGAALQAIEEAGLDVKKTPKRLAELERKVRTRSHGDALKTIADEIGLDPDFLDDVLELSKWPTDVDEPDIKAMKKHFAEYLERKPRFRKAKEEGTEAEMETKQGPRRALRTEEEGRGTAAAPTAYFSYRGSDLSNAEWMEKNGRQYAAAAREGRLRRVGD